MFKKLFFLSALALALLALFALPAQAAQKNISLDDFNGIWQMDAEKSKSFIKEATGRLQELSGFKFTINAKARSISMAWPGYKPKPHKISAAKAEGGRLACTLEGYQSAMILEKVSADEILVRDRDEALVFIRVK